LFFLIPLSNVYSAAKKQIAKKKQERKGEKVRGRKKKTIRIPLLSLHWPT